MTGLRMLARRSMLWWPEKEDPVMIAVIFEFHPDPDQTESYFEIAAALREELDRVEGFISVERFQSITHPGKYLSLSFFEDEAAVARWRQLSRHRKAQAAGRGGIFTEYRLRVAQVLRDYGMQDRDEAPEDSLRTHG